jgi:hypothetical protein
MLHEPDQKSGLEKTQDGTAALLDDQTPATPFSSAAVHSISSLSFPLRPHRNWFNSYNNEHVHENESKQTNERHQHRNTNDATTIRPDPNRDRHSQKREKIVDLGVVMILPQVHLRKPCYDFTFL